MKLGGSVHFVSVTILVLGNTFEPSGIYVKPIFPAVSFSIFPLARKHL